MRIFKQEAGVISEMPIWIAMHDAYMYDAESLLKLLWIIATEWKHDKHLAG